jgi:hypothetical protein
LDALQRWVWRGPPTAIVATVETTLLSEAALADLQPIVDDDFRQAETAWV